MDLALKLSDNSDVPVYRRLAEAMREAIVSGRLLPGQALPSSRELSESMKLSRFTVRKAYDDLISQGYVETAAGARTFVSRRFPGVPKIEAREEKNQAEVAWSSYARKVEATAVAIPERQELFAELNYGIPTSDQLPISIWRQLLYKHCRFKTTDQISYSADPLGYLPLRKAIADYLSRARAVTCDPDQIAIFSGTQPALDLLCRLMLNAGDSVAMEDPGYPGARRTFMLNGASIAPVHVDEQGLEVEQLNNLLAQPKLLYVTPSHQDPTGVVLPMARRMELLRWAGRSGCLIVEDDNDSEYRYSGTPIPALKGLDDNDCVIYMSGFWKTLGPLVVMGFVVLPRRLVKVFSAAKAMTVRDYPLIDQAVLAEFIAEGYLERHIKRTRSLYAKRRQSLVHALTLKLGKKLRISKETAGMHVAVRFDPSVSEKEVVHACAEAQMEMISSHPYYVNLAVDREFLIPFAHSDEEEMKKKVAQFAKALAI